MLSDEEKEAIDNMKSLLLYSKEHEYFSPFQEQEIDDMNIVLNIVEKQSKEIERINEILTWKQKHEEQLQKEIEELKQNIHLKEVYVLKTNDYIKGTNIEDELCNKKWEDKIKAKIEEIDRKIEFEQNEKVIIYLHKQKRVLQSLLEKE